jgi:putative Holliday junction resolvase
MSRLLGLDYGERRIGIAMSDPLHIIVQPFRTIEYKHQDEIWESLRSIIAEYEIEAIVVGMPLNLKGDKGQKAKTVEAFVAELTSRIPMPIHYWDERFTSVEAHRSLHEMGHSPSRKKTYVDQLAAVFLLQSFLDHRKITLRNQPTD